MELSIVIATLEGCPFEQLNDRNLVEQMLRESVEAGGFTVLNTHVHQFSPQGLTGACVLSESHIAIHTWPESGILFVDIATCSDAAGAEAAFGRICELMPHQAIKRRDVGYREDGQTPWDPRIAWLGDNPPRERLEAVDPLVGNATFFGRKRVS